MKILQVIPHYFPSVYFGGTPFSCHYLSRELVKLGNDVDVLTTDAFSRKQRYKKKSWPEKYDNYNIYRFKNLSNSLAFNNRFSIPIPRIKFFSKLKEYDIVQLHEYRNLLNVLLCLLKPITGAKYLLYTLGTYPIYNTQIGFKRLFDFLFSKIINNAIDIYVVVSNAERNDLLKAGVDRKKIKVIYYGVDFVNALTKKKTPYNFPYILYLGRIDKRKGVDKLIKAYAESEVSNRNVHLVIAGNDNDFMETCRKLIKKFGIGKMVHFYGPVKGEEKVALLKGANLLSYVTQAEAYGIVPVESVACGVTPVVAKDSGVFEVLKKYRIGLAVDFGNVESLSRILRDKAVAKNVVSDTTIKNLLKENSWSLVAAKFNILYGGLQNEI